MRGKKKKRLESKRKIEKQSRKKQKKEQKKNKKREEIETTNSDPTLTYRAEPRLECCSPPCTSPNPFSTLSKREEKRFKKNKHARPSLKNVH